MAIRLYTIKSRVSAGSGGQDGGENNNTKTTCYYLLLFIIKFIHPNIKINKKNIVDGPGVLEC